MLRQTALSACILLIFAPVALAQHFELIGRIENPRGEAGRGDVFGDEMAVVGDTLFVTAPDAPAGGAIYAFRDGDLFDTIPNPMGNTRLGQIAPLDDGLLVIAAGTTSAHLLFLQADGTHLHSFLPPAEGIPSFGINFAGLTDSVVVGSLDNTKGPLSGAVHLYSDNGQFQKTIYSPNAQDFGGFGNLVAPVGGDRFIVGASNEWFNGIRSGAAYLYDDEGMLLSTFFDPTPVAGNDLFARQIAAFGDLLLISDGTYVPSEGRNIFEYHAFDQTGQYLVTVHAPGSSVRLAGLENWSSRRWRNRRHLRHVSTAADA